MSAENATTLTPALVNTFVMVLLSRPPDTHTPTVLPFRSANVIAIF